MESQISALDTNDLEANIPSQAMFLGAQNLNFVGNPAFTIYGPKIVHNNYADVAGTSTIPKAEVSLQFHSGTLPPGAGLRILFENSSPSAMLNSKQRFPQPKCAEGTRLRILKDMQTWILSKEKSASMMWLRGSAGAGKSALAQSIAEWAASQNGLASTFFFARLAFDRNDGDKVVATMAHQLAQHFPPIRDIIDKTVRSQPGILGETNLSQIKQLIINPVKVLRYSFRRYYIAKLMARWRQPRLIVIDGLDECSEKKVQCDLLEVVAQAVQELRLPFRFLICSRPEQHILDTVKRISNAKGHRRFIKVDLDDEPDEIEYFLREKFEEIRTNHPLSKIFPTNWPPDSSIKTLMEKASKQFIYASTVIKYIEPLHHNPMDRLDRILLLPSQLSNDKPFAQVDLLYSYIFSSVMDLPLVKNIFGSLLIRRVEGDCLGNFANPEMLDKLFFLKAGTVRLALSELQCLVRIQDDLDTPVLLHASLGDFLLDPSRSLEFFIELEAVHVSLARGYLSLTKIRHWPHLSPRIYLLPFFMHFKEAKLTADLQTDLKRFEIIEEFEFVSFSIDRVPSHITKDYGSHEQYFEIEVADLPNFEWVRWHQRMDAWKSGLVQLYFHLYYQKVDEKSRQQVLQSQVAMLQTHYDYEANSLIGELVSLLHQKRFNEWPCNCRLYHPRSCRDDSELTYVLYLSFYSHILKAARLLSLQLNPPFITMAYRCLEVSSSFLWRNSADIATNLRWANLSLRAILDCTTLLLSSAHAFYLDSLVNLIIAYPRDGYLKRFPIQINALSIEVIKYCQKFPQDIPPHQLQYIEAKWHITNSS